MSRTPRTAEVAWFQRLVRSLLWPFLLALMALLPCCSDGGAAPGGSPPPWDLDGGGADGGGADGGGADAGSADAGGLLPDTGLVDAGDGDGGTAADPCPADPGPGPFPSPLITELMAVNETALADEDGDHPDWLELYNPTAAPIELGCYHLTDDPEDLEKWTFPRIRLLPRHYLVVFASGKDRRDPAQPLHTSFKLARDGEYLAVVTPDRRVGHAQVSWPPQVPDVSWGLPMQRQSVRLVSAGQELRWAPAAPDGPAADPSWRLPGFDDRAAPWSAGRTGLGWDDGRPPALPLPEAERGTLVASSLADWSPEGQQGWRGWTYGYWDRTADADGSYSVEDFSPFPRAGGGYGPDDAWTGTVFDWFDGDPPGTMVGWRFTEPGGADGPAEHWAIRRWESTVAGTLIVEWTLAKNTGGGTGVTGRVLQDGVELDTAAIAARDKQGVRRELVLGGVAPGTRVDFALDPTGPAGEGDGSKDLAVLEARLWLAPALQPHVATDVRAGRQGAHRLLLRAPFVLDDPSAHDRLLLRVRYDDGFAAWIDGQPVAQDGAPAGLDDGPNPDRPATQDRPVALAATPASFRLDELLERLDPGEHMLALDAFDAEADDGGFLIEPELEASRVVVAEGSRYLAVPTPGADNVAPGDGDLGPLVRRATEGADVAPGEAIAVTAEVLPITDPIAEVTLVWRVGFGPEQRLTMSSSDEPDGYRATIPGGAAGPGELVRWSVVAVDTAGRSSRLPAFLDARRDQQYYGAVVRDPALASNLPVVHWFTEMPELAATDGGARSVLGYRGEVYDNVLVRIHGQSAREFPKKGYNVAFPADHGCLLGPGMPRVKNMNLLTNYADKTKLRNTLAYEVFRAAGADYHLAFPVRVELNGSFYGVFDLVEDGGGRWLERLNYRSGGVLYKMYDNLEDARTAEKKTREDEDRADLEALVDAMFLDMERRPRWVHDHVDLARMANFLASLFVIADIDCCHKNYYAFLDDEGSGEWWYMPWDLDLSFGHNYSEVDAYFADELHPETPLFVARGNPLVGTLFAMPEFVEMYLRRTRTLVDELIQPPGTPPAELRLERRVDELAAQIGADGELDDARWPAHWGTPQTFAEAVQRLKDEYLAPRRAHVYGTLASGPEAALPPPQGEVTVRIVEAEPSPLVPSEAYVVLRNDGAAAADLSGWWLSGGGIEHVLRPGTVIPAGGLLFVTADARAFRARRQPPTGNQGLFVQGSWRGELVNPAGLVLFDAAGVAQP